MAVLKYNNAQAMNDTLIKALYELDANQRDRMFKAWHVQNGLLKAVIKRNLSAMPIHKRYLRIMSNWWFRFRNRRGWIKWEKC